jgi:hypothetical protein
MFSKDQKIKIAKVVEEIILSFNHPEMPKEKPDFSLCIKGKESWSYADIVPNWLFENEEPGVNPYNEMVAKDMEDKL